MNNLNKSSVRGFFKVDINRRINGSDVIRNINKNNKSPDFGKNHENYINEYDELKYYQNKFE